jgi:hypothetical protein
LLDLHSWRLSWLESRDHRFTADVRASTDCSLKQQLLHFRMIETDGRHMLRRGAREVAWAAQSHLDGGHVVPALSKQICDGKPLRFGHTPRLQELPTHPISELWLPLKHEDSRSGPGHDRGQGGASETTTHSQEVVVKDRHCSLSF